MPTNLNDPGALAQAIQTLSGSHDYPPAWYAQASIDPAPNQPNGLAWSPLLSASPPSGGPGLYNQTWTQNVFNQQFILTGPPANQLPTFTPVAAPFAYADEYQVGSVSDNGQGTITLGGAGSAPLSLLATTFTPLANVPQNGNPNLAGTGLSFQFQFTNPSPGDQLVVWARGLFNLKVPPIQNPFTGKTIFSGLNSGTLGYQTVPLFTMSASDAGPAAQFATVSLDGFANQNSLSNNANLVEGMLNATQQPVLGFSLIHAAGGQSSVRVSQLQQFSDGTTA